jgi:hypothetical protein
MASIVALLQACNEEVSIGSVVLHTCQYADRVVVIDDGSQDRRLMWRQWPARRSSGTRRTGARARR